MMLGQLLEREREQQILIARCAQDSNIKMWFMCKIEIKEKDKTNHAIKQK